MIYVHCRTNLDDVMRIEQWPEELPERPMLGDRILSLTDHYGYSIELEVFGLTWKKPKAGTWAPVVDHRKCSEDWYLEVELHIPSWQKSLSIKDWQEWYKKVRMPPSHRT
ncbi:hypothetical protein M0R72_07585 [Candidatus Pacearchaeota archaeon]|nr:hypothetical protein [Candidatus Pacearchaeota archaeon]